MSGSDRVVLNREGTGFLFPPTGNLRNGGLEDRAKACKTSVDVHNFLKKLAASVAQPGNSLSNTQFLHQSDPKDPRHKAAKDESFDAAYNALLHECPLSKMRAYVHEQAYRLQHAFVKKRKNEADEVFPLKKLTEKHMIEILLHREDELSATFADATVRVTGWGRRMITILDYHYEVPLSMLAKALITKANARAKQGCPSPGDRNYAVEMKMRKEGAKAGEQLRWLYERSSEQMRAKGVSNLFKRVFSTLRELSRPGCSVLSRLGKVDALFRTYLEPKGAIWQIADAVWKKSNIS